MAHFKGASWEDAFGTGASPAGTWEEGSWQWAQQVRSPSDGKARGLSEVQRPEG
jgi:hypothetical protein